MSDQLLDPAKLFLLISLLSKDRKISHNGKSFMKELILRRDTRLSAVLANFEQQRMGDGQFLEAIHELITEESMILYNDLFNDTSLEVGKTLSKEERDDKNLHGEKSLIYGEVEYQSFYRVLRKLDIAAGSTFYDLGSGTSYPVLLI